MDLATLLGLVGAVGIILTAILTGGELGLFINAPSLLIVVGGTIGAVMMKFTLAQFFGAFKVAMRAFIFRLDKPEALIEQTVEMANEARKGGLLALEGKETGNDFLAKGIQMMVDGHEPDVVRQTLLSDLNGAVIANVFAIPIADKLGLRANEERMVKSMIIDSLQGIQEGRNPRVIEEILKTYLPSSKRDLEAPEPG